MPIPPNEDKTQLGMGDKYLQKIMGGGRGFLGCQNVVAGPIRGILHFVPVMMECCALGNNITWSYELHRTAFTITHTWRSVVDSYWNWVTLCNPIEQIITLKSTLTTQSNRL